MLRLVATLAADAVLVCGAGVSQESGLPDGQVLARVAFDNVYAGDRCFPPSAVRAVTRALRWSAGEPGLRLELLLELMAREVPAATLAGVYSLVLNAEPCLAHYALAISGRPVVTTNQDDLIEQAGFRLGVPVDVLHLHGLASDPGSIVTILGQYVQGLPRQTAQDLRDRVAGRHLVVIGYSGRDLDVMPYFYAADRVTWLHHRSAGGGSYPAVEVRQLQLALGRRMRLVEHPNPISWVLDRLSATRRRFAAGFAADVVPARRPVLIGPPLDAFRVLPPLGRRLAMARVLLHVGRAQAVLEGLRRAARSHPRNPHVQLMLADALTQLNERPAALRRYARARVLSAEPDVAASALLGRASIFANSSEYDRALSELSEARTAALSIHDVRRRLQRRAWITALEARLYAMTGQEDNALRLYRATARLADRISDLDLRAHALIFGSDIPRSRGQYRRALADLNRVLADNELYGRAHTRVWGRFYRGMTLCASGEVALGITDLELCRAAAKASGNHQAVAWGSVILGSYRRPEDLHGAKTALDECASAIRASGGSMLMCEVRLAWERAELTRALGHDDQALRQVTQLQQRLESPSFPVRLPYMAAHVLALLGELARGRGDPSARELLRQARETFAALGWRHGTARIDVSLWLLSGRPSPPPGLLRRCRSAGFAAEVVRLTRPCPSYYPLHGL